MNSRRDFIKKTSLVSLAPILPSVIAQTANAAKSMSDERALVVIQLDGGNDGINTVVPFGDDAYAKARKKLRQETKDLHKLNDHVGLHRSMKPAFELFDDGRLSILQGVGYPNPNRSHFRSMNIWHTASLDDADRAGNGWLGKALDQQLAIGDATATADANAVFVGSSQVPPALWGRRSSAISLSKEDDLRLNGQLTLNAKPSQETLEIESFVSKQMVSAQHTAETFAKLHDRSESATTYPNSQLARQLKLVSKFLKSGSTARVFYTVQSGYDTHSQQEFTHSRLLSQFSGAMKAFLDDLSANGLDDRVIVLAFSEFGRRVAENVTAGTDHGSAGPVFLGGSPVRGGLVGTTPDLSDLVDGDLKTAIDFRQIYATILEQWLKVDPANVIAKSYEQLNLFS